MSACPPLSAAARCFTLAALLAVLCPADRLAADVVSVGAVTPDPIPVGGGVYSTQLIVGNGTNSTVTNDIWGLVSIDDGTLLQYGSLIAGYYPGYFGEVDVTGDFLAGKITQFNLSSVGGLGTPTAEIGYQGTGWLNVRGGARMTFTNTSGNLSLGKRASGVGYATFSDRYTMLTLSNSIYVGQEGVGDLKILDGALVRLLLSTTSQALSIGVDPGSYGSVTVDGQGTLVSSAANLRVGESGQGSLAITHGAMVDVEPIFPPLVGGYPSVKIGMNATGVGSAVVDGPGSRLQTHDTLVVGDAGVGTLEVRDGGVVDVLDKTVASVYVGPLGRIELAGGTLAGSSPALPDYGTTVDGFLGGSGLVRGTVQFNEDSFLEAYGNDQLQFQGDVSNQGAVTIDGGEMQFLAGFTNNAKGIFNESGRISLEHSGTVRFSQMLTNDGVLSNAHGATNIHGEIDNSGDIVVARDTVATFHDTVSNTGTITILPGGNALFLGDLIFSSMAALQMGVASSELAVNSAQINIDGIATLGGTLAVSLEGNYDSLVGQSFELITAGGIVGAFDSIQLPLLPNNLEVGVLYSANSVMMEIRIDTTSTQLAGDYNQDGTVNAADYSVWRNSLGQSGSGLAADGNGDSHVDNADYDLWKLHFGEVAIVGSGAGSGSLASAPEPSSVLLLVASLAATIFLRRRRFAG